MRIHLTLCSLAFALAAGCGNNNSTPDMGPRCAGGGNTCAAGGPVNGVADTHCVGMPAQMTSQAVCELAPDLGSKSVDAGASAGSQYGATMFGSEGDDDDCKYHVTFTVTPVYEHTNVTFTVSATYKTDGTPVIGANTIIQAYLSDTHPAPNAPTTTVEGPIGTYTIGPVLFDAAGRWTVRFHFFENCGGADPRSPHGHAAFYLDVP